MTEQETVTIEVNARDSLVAHINHLQEVLTKRNKKIASLEARLSQENESLEVTRARNEGFRKGWDACASEVMDSATRAGRALKAFKNDGFAAYARGPKDPDAADDDCS